MLLTMVDCDLHAHLAPKADLTAATCVVKIYF